MLEGETRYFVYSGIMAETQLKFCYFVDEIEKMEEEVVILLLLNKGVSIEHWLLEKNWSMWWWKCVLKRSNLFYKWGTWTVVNYVRCIQYNRRYHWHNQDSQWAIHSHKTRHWCHIHLVYNYPNKPPKNDNIDTRIKLWKSEGKSSGIKGKTSTFNPK